MSAINYNQLYSLQAKVLKLFNAINSSFYLTGGTALGRFYLNHRLSADLDFFVNNNLNFKKEIAPFEYILKNNFVLQTDGSLITDEFVRFLISQDNILLKIEFVNDVAYQYGQPIKNNIYTVDTIRNILSNKLTCIVGRDEPKDFFDIISIAFNYKFNWVDLINETKQKALINEIDISKRISEFPTEWLLQVDWLNQSPIIQTIKEQQDIIANDILLGKDNSICTNGRKLDDAIINFK